MSERVKKPTFLFIFTDEQKSDRFLAEAVALSEVAFVQHPLLGDGSTRHNPYKVLVTANLGNKLSIITHLESMAKKLGGYYLEKK